MRSNSSLLIALIIFIGCSSQPENELPGYFKNLENLTVYSADVEPAKNIKFKKEQRFSSLNGSLIGEVGDIAVDKANRVFVGDPQQHRIHIFSPNGRYDSYFGKEGRGPGEFQGLSTITIDSSEISVYDPVQLRMNFYALNTLSLSRTVNLNPKNQSDIEDLNGFYSPNRFWLRGDNTYLVKFSPRIFADPSHPRFNLTEERVTPFFIMNSKGRIVSDKLFEVKDTQYLTATVAKELRYTAFSFMNRPIVAPSGDDNIYLARTKHFLIEKLDPNGNYIRAFYHPVKRKRFSPQEAIQATEEKYVEYVSEWRVSVIKHADEENIPDKWPALNSMFIDDENRIWVSSIVNNEKVYQWWVLENSGKLIARFTWPRNRSIKVVKDGYLYAKETDEETGLAEVVRYRIDM